jgi:hypothetical protein
MVGVKRAAKGVENGLMKSLNVIFNLESAN